MYVQYQQLLQTLPLMRITCNFFPVYVFPPVRAIDYSCIIGDFAVSFQQQKKAFLGEKWAEYILEIFRMVICIRNVRNFFLEWKMNDSMR